MNEIPNHVRNALEWNSIALFAYESYSKKGRIVVGIEKDEHNTEGALLMAVHYDYQNGKPDKTVAQILSNYDPEMEIVIQFVDGLGQVRTQGLRTAEGSRHPKRVYFFEILRRLEEEPEPVDVKNLPVCLIQALTTLDNARKAE